MGTVRTFLGVCLLFFSTSSLFAQENPERVILKKDFEIRKYTIMERFEPELIISAEERAEMKMKRIEEAEYTLNVLDTMKISNRKRHLLLRDLKYNPFSNRLNKFIVDSKFDDAEVVKN